MLFAVDTMTFSVLVVLSADIHMRHCLLTRELGCHLPCLQTESFHKDLLACLQAESVHNSVTDKKHFETNTVLVS